MANYYEKSLVEGLEPLAGSGKSIEERYMHYRAAAGIHALVGVYQRGFEYVIDVTSPEEFDEFEGQYRRGLFISRSYYAVPKERIEKAKVW